MAQAPDRPGMVNPTQGDPLAQLRDIHVPETIDTWPPAPGWWLLAVLAIAAIGAAAWWLYRRWRGNRYRREALAELESLRRDFEESGDTHDFLERFSALLKRVALTHYPRESVANLTGERWVEFLDRTIGTSEFSMGAGQVLISGPYEAAPQADVERLAELGEHWIRQHGEAA